jgi:hypothetical protein
VREQRAPAHGAPVGVGSHSYGWSSIIGGPGQMKTKGTHLNSTRIIRCVPFVLFLCFVPLLAPGTGFAAFRILDAKSRQNS